MKIRVKTPLTMIEGNTFKTKEKYGLCIYRVFLLRVLQVPCKS